MLRRRCAGIRRVDEDEDDATTAEDEIVVRACVNVMFDGTCDEEDALEYVTGLML